MTMINATKISLSPVNQLVMHLLSLTPMSNSAIVAVEMTKAPGLIVLSET